MWTWSKSRARGKIPPLKRKLAQGLCKASRGQRRIFRDSTPATQKYETKKKTKQRYWSKKGIFSFLERFHSFFSQKKDQRPLSALLLQRGYQLAFVTPMTRPWAASSRNFIRESPQKRYTEWLRPVTVHRFDTRVRELFRGNLLSC